MTKGTRNTLIIICVIGLLAFAAVYFIRLFFSSFAPPVVTVTQKEIKNSHGFSNPVTFEKLTVDSIGIEHRPVRYVINYFSSCLIKWDYSKSGKSIKKILFQEAGPYRWTEETVNIRVTHEDGYSKRVHASQRMLWSMGEKKFDTCPFKFEKGNWYFIDILDPKIAGIYVYINDNGDLQQYTTYSGISPI